MVEKAGVRVKGEAKRSKEFAGKRANYLTTPLNNSSSSLVLQQALTTPKRDIHYSAVINTHISVVTINPFFNSPTLKYLNLILNNPIGEVEILHIYLSASTIKYLNLMLPYSTYGYLNIL